MVQTSEQKQRVSAAVPSAFVWLSLSDSAAMRRPDGSTKGSDAMALAARKFHVHVVRALVRAGADPTLPIDGGKSAVEMMPGTSLFPFQVSSQPTVPIDDTELAQSWTSHGRSTKVICKKS